MLCGLKWGTFLLFAGFVVLMTLFVILCVPETKGVPIEELNEVIMQKVGALCASGFVCCARACVGVHVRAYMRIRL